jgi:hypothetical protein
MQSIIFLTLLVGGSGCATLGSRTDVVETANNTYTLRYATGSHGMPLYQEIFEKTAAEKCPNGSDILEKSHTPSTIPIFEGEDHYYYWVIRCK